MQGSCVCEVIIWVIKQKGQPANCSCDVLPLLRVSQEEDLRAGQAMRHYDNAA